MSVLPEVAGLDRLFDYTVPDDLDGDVGVGTRVRVDLGGRRVAGWVVADRQPPGGRALRPLLRVSGWGPEPAVVELSAWAAWRWAGRRNAVLATAGAGGVVAGLPPPDTRRPAAPAGVDTAVAATVARALDLPASVVRLPPAADPVSLVALAAQRGPVLVVVPSAAGAAALAARLRAGGAGVAEVPRQWAAALAGAGVVIGARAAAWAPCPGMAAAVVLDAHDEVLVQEQAPAWWAPAVAVERARRAGVPCVLVSGCPTLDLQETGPVLRLGADRERRGWAPLVVADRRHDDPRLGLYSAPLVRAVREERRVIGVLNRTGRARLLVCAACAAVARCERCRAAVVATPATGAGPAEALRCGRCGLARPQVCDSCGSVRLRHLRAGVARVREELETLAGRPVGEVTAATAALPATDVLVGTEAVLRRAGPADVVAFLDFDQELLAPRLRAAEEALALLALASRMVRGRRGRVIVQTRLPGHEVLDAARLGEPERVSAVEAQTRRVLRLPPFAAVAVLSGPGAADLATAVRACAGEQAAGVRAGAGPSVAAGEGVEVSGADAGRWMLRASSHRDLCDALAAAGRPPARVRVEVDPVRL